jgi:hypothetical protein
MKIRMFSTSVFNSFGASDFHSENNSYVYASQLLPNVYRWLSLYTGVAFLRIAAYNENA